MQHAPMSRARRGRASVTSFSSGVINVIIILFLLFARTWSLLLPVLLSSSSCSHHRYLPTHPPPHLYHIPYSQIRRRTCFPRASSLTRPPSPSLPPSLIPTRVLLARPTPRAA